MRRRARACRDGRGRSGSGTLWPPITDPPTGTYTAGKWVWAELLTRDVGRAAAFYGKVFGWTFETYGPGDDTKTYTLVSSAGTPIAGMIFLNPRDRSMKPDARWIGLVSAGGRVAIEPLQAHGTRVALLIDPTGAPFAVAEWPGH